MCILWIRKTTTSQRNTTRWILKIISTVNKYFLLRMIFLKTCWVKILNSLFLWQNWSPWLTHQLLTPRVAPNCQSPLLLTHYSRRKRMPIQYNTPQRWTPTRHRGLRLQLLSLITALTGRAAEFNVSKRNVIYFFSI